MAVHARDLQPISQLGGFSYNDNTLTSEED